MCLLIYRFTIFLYNIDFMTYVHWHKQNHDLSFAGGLHRRELVMFGDWWAHRTATMGRMVLASWPTSHHILGTLRLHLGSWESGWGLMGCCKWCMIRDVEGWSLATSWDVVFGVGGADDMLLFIELGLWHRFSMIWQSVSIEPVL